MRELSRLIAGFNIFVGALLVGAGLTVWGRETSIAPPIVFVVIGLVVLLWSEFVFHVTRVENVSSAGSARFVIRVNLLLGCLIMMGLVASILADCVGNPAKVKAHDENEATNLAAIKSELLDFEELSGTNMRAVKVDESAKPADVTSWALLRRRKYETDNGEQYQWKLVYAVPDEDDHVWSQEDLEEIDAIAIADSSYMSGNYRSTSGGEGTADSESVKLLYYNPKTGAFFGEDNIEGAPMGETVDTWHAKIDDSRVIEMAEKDIEYHSGSTNSPYEAIGIAFMAAVAIFHIVTSVMRARARNRRAAM